MTAKLSSAPFLHPLRRAMIREGASKVLLVGAQVAALALVNSVGHAAARALRFPVPGNLLGMLLLLALLWTGAVRLEWIQAGAALLVRHLAFFFVPITVGLTAFAGVFRDQGPAILATLLVSAAVGICSSGWISQALARGEHWEAP